jgi:hypothetical protein
MSTTMSDILVTPGFTPHALVIEELHVVSSNEPASFAEVERSLSWRKAMMEEMDSIEENGIWSLIDLPPSRKLIGVKWVFKVKQDEHGAASKHKARLVVKGYVQRHGIDYNEVFAPVARLDSVCFLIAPYGRQIGILEWRHAGGGLRRVVSGFHHHWQVAQSAQTKEGIVQAASRAMSLDREGR